MGIKDTPSTLSSFTSRLLTFRHWSGLQTPFSLASAGFFYTQYGDTVECFKCGVTVRKWLATDDPISEHLRWSKTCLYAQLMQPKKLPVDLDVCGP